jgi:hypothetical protein
MALLTQPIILELMVIFILILLPEHCSDPKLQVSGRLVFPSLALLDLKVYRAFRV